MLNKIKVEKQIGLLKLNLANAFKPLIYCPNHTN